MLHAPRAAQAGAACQEVEDLMLSGPMLAHVLAAAESMLTHTLATQQSNGDLAATWTAAPEARKATESLLGMPDWRAPSQPLMHACTV